MRLLPIRGTEGTECPQAYLAHRRHSLPRVPASRSPPATRTRGEPLPRRHREAARRRRSLQPSTPHHRRHRARRALTLHLGARCTYQCTSCPRTPKRGAAGALVLERRRCHPRCASDRRSAWRGAIPGRSVVGCGIIDLSDSVTAALNTATPLRLQRARPPPSHGLQKRRAAGATARCWRRRSRSLDFFGTRRAVTPIPLVLCNP
mmetsp:Transcript_26284/g.91426  ORF Transcript_26284/g.91426 Transcript_26284/m.91426 type:complete len:205 (+) Transcript_26284:1958-2572(+)